LFRGSANYSAAMDYDKITTKILRRLVHKHEMRRIVKIADNSFNSDYYSYYVGVDVYSAQGERKKLIKWHKRLENAKKVLPVLMDFQSHA